MQAALLGVIMYGVSKSFTVKVTVPRGHAAP